MKQLTRIISKPENCNETYWKDLIYTGFIQAQQGYLTIQGIKVFGQIFYCLETYRVIITTLFDETANQQDITDLQQVVEQTAKNLLSAQ